MIAIEITLASRFADFSSLFGDVVARGRGDGRGELSNVK